MLSKKEKKETQKTKELKMKELENEEEIESEEEKELESIEEEEEENEINTSKTKKKKLKPEKDNINSEESEESMESMNEIEEIPLEKQNIDISEIKIRIQTLLSILSDFNKKRDPSKTRSFYINELKNLSMQYYDYNSDICDLIFNLFAPNEAIDFMESNQNQKIITIRSNSLKIKRRELAKNLIQRGVNLDPIGEWTKVGLKIYSSQVPIGATPEYLSGQYMLQSASSFLPVLALNPQPNEKILDMCASPGGKSTYISQLMKNTGLLVANDLKKERLKSLFFNVHRLGIKNCIITNYDGRYFPKLYNKFDRVLLDAPCSGLGIINKDQSIKVNRTYKEILNNSKLQKELILSAIDSVNLKGTSKGIIVYSTCSISVEENEWVVDYALKHRYIKVIDTGINLGENGFVSFREKHFHPSLKNTKRIYPHIHGMDGFFIAKLQKYADGIKEKKEKNEEKKMKKEKKKNKKENKNKKVEDVENNLSLEEEPEDIQNDNDKFEKNDESGNEESSHDSILESVEGSDDENEKRKKVRKKDYNKKKKMEKEKKKKNVDIKEKKNVKNDKEDNNDKNEKKEKKNIVKKKKKNEKDEDNEKLLEKKRKKNK